MSKFSICFEHAGRTTGEILEIDELSLESLARCTDLAHEMLANVERHVRKAEAKRQAREQR